MAGDPVGYMQRDLVERHGWIDRQGFLDGVALGQTMPGPLAAQVAMWVGYLRRGTLGALAVAVAFIAPLVPDRGRRRRPVLRVLRAASRALFYGIAPAVMAIITIAAVNLVRLTDRRDWRLWTISALVFGLTAVKAFVSGATAAAAGALSGAVVVLTRQAVTDWPTAAIALVTLGLLWKFKIGEPYIVIAAGALGILIH